MSNVTCNKCGWVHFAVTLEYVQQWKADWKQWCKEWDVKRLKGFGIKNRKPPSDKSYYRCFFCGNPYTDFRASKAGDCPDGCTIQPILGYQYVNSKI